MEKLEFQDSLISYVKNIHGFVEELSQGQFADFVDRDVYQGWLYKQLQIGDKANNWCKTPKNWKDKGTSIVLES